MSYTALYRKLRPKSFKDVIGQQHIVRTIQNQITTNRVSHAYLFCGTRGTGKTSTAKIFAKAINCMSPEEGGPCNKCISCEAINSSRTMNVIEIDAASNNGVDNIREIREEVKYPPTEGNYKVYIIDEVHMLSTGAFNALLKTLEEPPNHVVFILATTDPQKIPPTILSRCQRFDFKRITQQQMTEKLKQYMSEENINISDSAIQYISSVSDGAMRDALSILDQTISFYYNQNITLENVLEIMGSVDNKVFFDLTEALSLFDSIRVLEIINDIYINGRDINQFVNDFISHLRNLLISSNLKGDSLALDFSEENIERLKVQASKINQQALIHYINAFSALQNQIKYASNEVILMEVLCLKLCNPETQKSDEALFSRIEKLEAKMNERINNPIISNNITNNEYINTEPVKKLEKAIPDDINNVKKKWEEFVSNFKMPLRGMLNSSTANYLEGDTLVIISKNPVTSEHLQNPNAIEQIKNVLADMFEKDFDICFLSKDEYDKRHKQIYGIVDENIFNNKDFTEIFDDDIIDIIIEED